MVRALTAEQARLVEEAAVAGGADLAALMRAAGAAVAAEITAAVARGRGGRARRARQQRRRRMGRCPRAARRRAATVRVLSLVEPGSLGGIAGEAARDAIAAGVAWRDAGERLDRGRPGRRRRWSSMRCSASGASGPLRAPLDSLGRGRQRLRRLRGRRRPADRRRRRHGRGRRHGGRGRLHRHLHRARSGGWCCIPAPAFAGEIVIADIGIDPASGRRAPERRRSGRRTSTRAAAPAARSTRTRTIAAACW